MVNDFPFVGVVLNGGRSERMGTDKANLALGEETLLQLTISGLREVHASAIYVVGTAILELPRGPIAVIGFFAAFVMRQTTLPLRPNR